MIFFGCYSIYTAKITGKDFLYQCNGGDPIYNLFGPWSDIHSTKDIFSYLIILFFSSLPFQNFLDVHTYILTTILRFLFLFHLVLQIKWKKYILFSILQWKHTLKSILNSPPTSMRSFILFRDLNAEKNLKIIINLKLLFSVYIIVWKYRDNK